MCVCVWGDEEEWERGGLVRVDGVRCGGGVGVEVGRYLNALLV